MLDVQCECGTQLRLGDEWAGRQGKCPRCGSVLNVPLSPPPIAASLSSDMPPVQIPPPMQLPPVQSPASRVAAVAPVTPRAGIQKPVFPSQAGTQPAVPPALAHDSNAESPVESRSGGSPLPIVAIAAGTGALVILLVLTLWIFGSGGTPVAVTPVEPKTAPQPRPATVNPKSTPVVKAPDAERPLISRPVVPDPVPTTDITSPITTNDPRPNPTQEPISKPPKTRRPEGLTGVSRQYDDLQCRMIQGRHAIAIPASATILEVNGERLPIANPAALAASPAPLLHLPRGTHAVRFRLNESPLTIEIAEDFFTEYQAIGQFFDASGMIRTPELLTRGARAMDVHGAPYLLNLMAASHASQDRWPAAERSFRRALVVNPTFSPAHLNLAQCLLHRQARDAAIQELELAEAFNVGNVFGLAPAISELRRELKLPLPARQPLELAAGAYAAADPLSEEDQRITAFLQGVSKYAVKDEERAKILNNLGVHFADTHQPEWALYHYRTALASLKNAGPDRFQLARQILSHMSDACRAAGFSEADEYQAMQEMVSP